MAKLKFYQRQFFIKKSFQAKFILLYSLSVVGIVGLVTFFLYRQIAQAVETHLYSTHVKIARVGDFLRDLLFDANFIVILAIISTVLMLSLVVFRRINRNFEQIDQSIMAMSSADFSGSIVPSGTFFKIGRLSEIIEDVRGGYAERFELLDKALMDLDHGCESGNAALLKSGQCRLEAALSEITIVED